MREDLMAVSAAIYTDGWNYLRNQCGYDSEPGGDLVSVYHLCKMDPETNDSTPAPEEVRLPPPACRHR
jgi:NAD(P)H-quinone oxidoreductase subunit J